MRLPANSRLLPLATAMVGRRRPSEIIPRALDSLRNAYPGTLWLLLQRRPDASYDVQGTSPVHADNARALCHAAEVGRVELHLHEPSVGLLRLGTPSWARTEDSANLPSLILGVWTLQGGDRPRQEELDLATHLVHTANATAREMETLRQQNAVDGLTGVLNRRAIMDTLAQEKARALRYGDELAVLYVDVDNFKSINDVYGHRTGDEALIGTARLLRHGLRACDSIGRIGGDEFLIVLPGTSQHGGQRLAQRLEQRMSQIDLDIDGANIRLGVTIGAASLSEVQSGDVVDLADQRMLESKKTGRGKSKTLGSATLE